MDMYLLAGSHVTSRKICDTQNEDGKNFEGLKNRKLIANSFFSLSIEELLKKYKY